MTLWASPSCACPRVSRSRSLAGVRPELAGCSAAPPACTEGSGPCAPPSSRALPCWRMRDAELSACWTAACSISACASRCRFRTSGVEGAGMARSSVAAAMSFWLACGGVSGLSTLMRSRACLPNSRACSPRAEASPAIEARSNRTVRYSSASLASSSRAWASCALMSPPSTVRGEGRFALQPCVVQFPEQEEPLCRRHLPRRWRSLGRWRLRHSTPARGHSSRRWSRRSSRTSSPWRRGTAGTSLGPVRRKSPTLHIHAKWQVAARRWSLGTTRRQRRR
jgi:hypothetical protein